MFGVHHPVSANRNARHLRAFPFQLHHGREHRGVLDRARDQVRPRLAGGAYGAENREICQDSVPPLVNTISAGFA